MIILLYVEFIGGMVRYFLNCTLILLCSFLSFTTYEIDKLE